MTILSLFQSFFLQYLNVGTATSTFHGKKVDRRQKLKTEFKYNTMLLDHLRPDSVTDTLVSFYSLVAKSARLFVNDIRQVASTKVKNLAKDKNTSTASATVHNPPQQRERELNQTLIQPAR